MNIRLKRAYDPASKDDGLRVLVDRLWPRGVAKEQAAIGRWLKELAPSSELRQWFGHDPLKWAEFRERYFLELDGRPETVGELLDLARSGQVTLVYAARDEAHNNAVALKAYLEERCQAPDAPSVD